MILAWRSARITVMDGEEASQALLSIRLQQLKKAGKNISNEEQAKLLSGLKKRYGNEMEPTYAAARLWVDDMIDPLETRQLISLGIETANNNPEIPKFNVGAPQT